MIFASILKAEKNWKALIIDREQNPKFIEIVKWGIPLNSQFELVPLDDLEEPITVRKNFITVINPNDEALSLYKIIELCDAKAKELGWA